MDEMEIEMKKKELLGEMRMDTEKKENKDKVIVYSTPTCPYCNMAKAYFEKKGVEYVEYDVSADPEKGKEMVQKSGQMGVPVIDIKGKIIVGFNKEAIDAALAG